MTTIIIFCAILLLTIGILLFAVSSDNCLEIFSTLSKIAFQSVLSGLITFIGLLITISFQTKQAEEKRLLDLCPCFIVEGSGAASALMDQHDFTDEGHVVFVCSDSTNQRSCVCLLHNTKAVYALNIELLNDRNELCYSLGSKAKVDESLLLVLLGNNPSFFSVRFKDSYGNQYVQRIEYKYTSNNKYVFISYKPEKGR